MHTQSGTLINRIWNSYIALKLRIVSPNDIYGQIYLVFNLSIFMLARLVVISGADCGGMSHESHDILRGFLLFLRGC